MVTILPVVKKINEKEGFFFFSSDTRISLDKNLGENSFTYAKLLQKCIKENIGFDIQITKGSFKKGDILLNVGNDYSYLKTQEYELNIETEGVFLNAGDEAGLLYSVETLCQVITQSGGSLACLEIKDSPDFPVRGYYLDQSRGRVYKLDYFKKVINTLAKYKINQFQLYIEHTFLFEGLSEVWRNETPLTAEDILELDAYCNQFHIELVPSLSSFGHLYTLLGSKSFNHFCEMPDSVTKEFSFFDRMQHHTVNVSDDKVLPFIKDLISKYMSLFTSNKFNICADETFDLGKGKSKSLADAKGVHRIYIDYVKELCNYLISEGKIPMFWGDIICGQPELAKELPEQVICLNWGYAPNQIEEPIKKMASTGVKQYLCPGVCSWNKWTPLVENSYLNITRMCNFAKKYNAIGILNTDWGDFGHINQPELSVIGLIYGACFSWNCEKVAFRDINQSISEVEFNDKSKSIVTLISDTNQYMKFDWCQAVFYYESIKLNKAHPDMEDLYADCDINESCSKLKSLLEMLMKTSIDISSKEIIPYIYTSIEGVYVWNLVKKNLQERKNCQDLDAIQKDGYEIASMLESWFMKFKDLWRKTSREGDLHYIADIVFWYCDLLRSKECPILNNKNKEL